MPLDELFIREDLREFIPREGVFAFIASLEGEEFRALESRRTIATEFGGKRYFVKYHRGIPSAEIFKNLVQLRLPIVSARNEWRAIRRLHELDILAPRIAAYGKRGLLPQTCESFIVTEDVGTQLNLEDLTRDWGTNPPPFAEKLALLEEVAGISRLMHSHGICHRDFYICHFLISGQKNSTGKKLTLIDLHRALLKKNLAMRWVIKDLGSLYFSALNLGLTKRDLLRFIGFYSGVSLRTALLEQQSFWDEVLSRAMKLKSRHS
ncbi:MAG: heptose I phosphotransferase [Pseudohongiellaceae bacterium]|jgi:heptose I phosphotransferase